MSFGIRGNADL